MERHGVDQALACAVIGDASTVEEGIEAFIERHKPDELLITANVFEHAARRRSFEIAAAARDRLSAATLQPG
jgi:alkanesulfonate monooxygenase SsuD/methylene tetrahydromethanopterin reductase-like flavin-dependent oxidoreductase (luciferase family)